MTMPTSEIGKIATPGRAVLVASGNRKKLEELRRILDGTGVSPLPPEAFGGLPEVEEDADTFEENAAKKALSAWRHSGMPAVADDSGLEVDALGGRPGIHSARYAGPDASDADRMSKLLAELGGRQDRGARFVCAIAVCAADGGLAVFRGVVEGQIGFSPRGDNGFGYDPVFIPAGYAQTFAELPAAVKDRISHRAAALAAARARILEVATPIVGGVGDIRTQAT